MRENENTVRTGAMSIGAELERTKNLSGLKWGFFLFFVLYVIWILFPDTYAEVLFDRFTRTYSEIS